MRNPFRLPFERGRGDEFDPREIAESLIETPGLREFEERLAEEEAELGLEYKGRDHGMNRKQRRAVLKNLKQVTRRPDGMKRLRHPLLRTLTPYGVNLLAKRRGKNARGKASRQAQQQVAAAARRKRQKINKRRKGR